MNNLITYHHVGLVLLSTLTLQPSTASAQSTAFTYQGQLQNSGTPASGNYDFTFALFNNNSTNTGQVGTMLTNLDVGVTNGLFTVMLNFGAGVFTGPNYWLSIGVRTNGGASFTALNPLQALTPTPYAINAASANSVAATNITGSIPLTELQAGSVTNAETGVTLNGTFSGDGSGLMNTVTTANYVCALDFSNHGVPLANDFQGVSFASTSITNGWNYLSGSTTFTCQQSGLYLVHYDAEVDTTTNNPTTITLRVMNYATTTYEIQGSESAVTLAVANQNVPVSKSFLAFFQPGNQLQIQFASDNTSGQLVGGLSTATYQPSISLTIIRIQ